MARMEKTAELEKEILAVTKPEALGWEILTILMSVAFGMVLWYTQAAVYVLGWAGEAKILLSFLAGLFFSSLFTTVPATVALVEIAPNYSVFWTAFFGGLGALLGDFLIFRFLKDHISEAFLALLQKPQGRWRHIFHLRLFRWLTPLLGAIIIASPLPDEFGLAIWGISRLRLVYVIPLSFTLNFLGILIIGLVAKSL